MKKFFVSLLVLAFVLFMVATYIPAPSSLKIPIFVINLDNAKWRLNQIKKRLSGLYFTRVSATGPKDILITYTTKNGKKRSINNLSMKPQYLYSQKADWNPPITIHCSKNDRFIWTSHTIMAPGEYGCICSHRKIWKDIIKNKISMAMIFEDDANFVPAYKAKLHLLKSSLPQNFDLIELKMPLHKVEKEKKYNAMFDHYEIPSDALLLGSEGYIISYEGAKKLLEFTAKLNLPLDNTFGNAIKQKKINAFKVNLFSKLTKGQEHLRNHADNSIIR